MAKNTPRQDYVWAMWENCKATGEFSTSTTYIAEVLPDGRYRSNTTIGPFSIEWPRIQACMNQQFRAHPYLGWLKATEPAPSQTSGVQTAVTNGPIVAPVWNVGDEWQYAYQGPSDSGTYVWTVDRMEMLDELPHYVIKSGTREIFYRVSDLASSLERVDGITVSRHTPSRLSYHWPLTVGKSWDQRHRSERPVDRQTTDRNSQWTVEAEETVTVPAGTFRTVRITWRNKNTNSVIHEMWYAPEVKQFIKIREVLRSGTRERELIAFKLR